MIIKGMLKKELENSTRLKAGYEKELAKLPVGSLYKKNIKGHFYYYLIKRVGRKVVLEYRGKQPNESVIKQYAEAKKLRAVYRKSLSKVKKQIKYLRGALRGKEPV